MSADQVYCCGPVVVNRLDQQTTEGGNFDATVIFYIFRENIWVDFKYVLWSSRKSDGTDDLGKVF